ncbi:MAG TPA: hypothetical protein VNG13_08555 [Mycobacteriales bacterium]|nr:hypothetical protein [Mycobacteriales bacterium]
MPTRTPTAPLYVLAGAGDLAVEKLRELPTTVAKFPVELQEQLQARVNVLRAQAKGLPKNYRTPATAFAFQVETVKTQVETVKTQVGTLRSRATDLAGRTSELYDELATRGRGVVGQIRRQPATRKAGVQRKSATTKAKAARTSAEKTVQATVEATESAAGQIG